ncbi:hypothetical protein C8R44DRAFT_785576 [Mycena epipterygia]|nr:hypothetical protein C8R44DRAFT_785576 [Mycena epipterygia]
MSIGHFSRRFHVDQFSATAPCRLASRSGIESVRPHPGSGPKRPSLPNHPRLLPKPGM